MSARLRIAVIEDDETIRRLLRMTVGAAGLGEVTDAARGDDGFEMVLRERPDVLILDLMLPGMDGMSVCRRLRARPEFADLGIIMLTARSETEDIVAGLDAGADDYVTKPFSRSVLVARIAALQRRRHPPASGVEMDGLVVDEPSGSAALDGVTLSLTRTELAILARFVSHPARVYTRGQIAAVTGGSADLGRTVDVQIAGLRKKLGRWAEHVETVRGVGYRVK